LEKVLRGLTNSGGPHFWLVVAPPQLGKTWFLERLSADRALSEPVPWTVKLVDLRSQPPEIYGDAAALLTLLFGRAAPAAIDEATLRNLAQEISRSGRPHLCLLDSAELLTEEAARTVRACLSQIYRFVQDTHKDGVRLTFIVASRRDDEWRGVTPAPRLSPLPLTEFTVDVVQQALHDLSAEMEVSFPAAELTRTAIRIHRLTEGVPSLLTRCLQWVRAEQWLAMDRLETQESFEQLTGSYIQQELFTSASLVPAGQKQTDEVLRVLMHAYRALTPYRLFTQSHLRHHIDSDPVFRTYLEAAGWDMADLWSAINDTSLLRRPLSEPWQEIHAAIRRLLYRYFYKSDDQRRAAHSAARRFMAMWADGQVGTEQVVGLVECLWHEANLVSLDSSSEARQELVESARSLFRYLGESPAYTLDELRAFAVQRLRNDEEFQETVSASEGLFDRLVASAVNL
jgi:hypothetical protein